MKHIREFIQITDGLADPLRRGFLQKLDEIEQKIVIMSKEEAIEFAKKYLFDRKKWNTKLDIGVANELSNLEVSKITESIERTWNIATEFILLDIIPYLYGEALD